MLQPPFPEKILFYSLFLSHFNAFTLESTLPIKIHPTYLCVIYLLIYCCTSPCHIRASHGACVEAREQLKSQFSLSTMWGLGCHTWQQVTFPTEPSLWTPVVLSQKKKKKKTQSLRVKLTDVTVLKINHYIPSSCESKKNNVSGEV